MLYQSILPVFDINGLPVLSKNECCKPTPELGVETQLNNLGACRFYEANEFLVHKVEYLYHCWIK
jgi:hypothetical protein